MIAQCRWSVCAAFVADYMMLDAIRKTITDQKSATWWRDEYFARRLVLDYFDPDGGSEVSLQVGTLDDLLTAVRLLREARAIGVYVVVSCETPAVVSTVSIGALEGDRYARVHQKPIELDKVNAFHRLHLSQAK